MLHRAVLAGAVRGTPSAWEMVLGLLSFAFASVGLLLLIHGARLFDDPRRRRRMVPRSADHDPWPGIDGREGVASMLAERAIAAAQVRRCVNRADPTDIARRKEGPCPSSHPISTATGTASPR
jgi:hypothetical protein